MTPRRQQFDKGRGHGRRNLSRPAKVCWVTFLSVGLCLSQLSPVLANRSFNSPMVHPAASPPNVSPHAGLILHPQCAFLNRFVDQVVLSGQHVDLSFHRNALIPLPVVCKVKEITRHHFPRGRVLKSLPLGYAQQSCWPTAYITIMQEVFIAKILEDMSLLILLLGQWSRLCLPITIFSLSMGYDIIPLRKITICKLQVAIKLCQTREGLCRNRLSVIKLL